MKVIIYADNREDRLYALRAVEYLIEHPEKCDVVLSWDTVPVVTDVHAYRTRRGTIGAIVAQEGVFIGRR